MTGWPPNSQRSIPAADFNPTEPTTRGGPDYGRFVEAVRTLQDHARAADAPDEVITKAADLIEKASTAAGALSTPTSGRRRRAGGWTCPTAATSCGVPAELHKTDDGRDRRHGAVPPLPPRPQRRRARRRAWRSCSTRCSASPPSGSRGSLYQRTAFLHVDYRKIVPIEKELQVDAGIDRVDGRKIFVAGRLLDGEVVLAEADALFVKLNPGQP